MTVLKYSYIQNRQYTPLKPQISLDPTVRLLSLKFAKQLIETYEQLFWTISELLQTKSYLLWHMEKLEPLEIIVVSCILKNCIGSRCAIYLAPIFGIKKQIHLN